MPIFISMLRGINVGGRKVLMTDLKTLYASLGFEEIVTYIQSGNVIFKASSKKNGVLLGTQIQAALKEKYPFDIPVIVRSLAEMKSVLAQNPFLKRSHVNTEKLHVTFLANNPEAALVKALEEISFPRDEYIIQGKEIFLQIPESYGETKLSNSFLEKKLKVSATTRNWKTVNKLVEMANAIT